VHKPLGKQDTIVDVYRKRAKHYDASGISGLEQWRKRAVSALKLGRGDLVVDVGCGTGLNFALLQEAIGLEGRIIGVDLTDAMLDQARQRIVEHGWQNVELVQSDAAQYAFPDRVDGIISTFALTFVPDPACVIQNGCKALAPGRKWVVLDMAWPERLPLWWQRVLFFLPSFGITPEVIKRRPWKTVWQTMERQLVERERKQFGAGFFYLSSGRRPD
jgi:demethylmenaquinone methyltransferase/2-methoxy-6-polyprenyl-1,4-benzoquinol methylase